MLFRQPHPRREHAAVGIGQKLYVWGGEGDHTKIQTSMIESFDLSSESWEQPKPLNRPLPDRAWDMTVTSDGHNTYSYGGRVGATVFFNTLYQYDISRQQCREIIPRNPSHTPRKQSGSGMVYYNQKLVVYGGCSGERGHRDELYTFDLRTNLWSAQPTTGKKPPPLAWHTFTKVDHHRAVVFGGFTGEDEVNDTYILDMETWHWTKLVIFGAKPPVRNSYAACCIAGPLTGQEHPLLMLIGGWYPDGSLLGDVWLLDVDRSTWTEVTLPVVFTPRRGHSATVFGYGASFRVVVLFGGYMRGGFDSYIKGLLSETMLLFLELRGGLWQVTRVVKPDELGRPDERLREQMRKLELSPQEATATAAEQSLREEQERRAEAERQVQLLQRRVTDSDQLIRDLTQQAEEAERRAAEAEVRLREREERRREMEGRWREAENRAREAEGRSAQMEGRLRESERRSQEMKIQLRGYLRETGTA